MSMKRVLIALAAATALASITARAAELGEPQGRFRQLDHVFLIIMENQTNTDILVDHV